MKRKMSLVVISALLLIVGASRGQSGSGVKGTTQPDPTACPYPDESAAGQSQTQKKPAEKPSGPTVMCPMMGMMGRTEKGQPMMGNMNEMMQAMPRRMAGMFSLSAEEIGARLTEKKSELGLSDAQVKEVADLIASSEQQKIETKMRGMMGPMRAGQMTYPCMQSGPK